LFISGIIVLVLVKNKSKKKKHGCNNDDKSDNSRAITIIPMDKKDVENTAPCRVRKLPGKYNEL